MLLLELILAVGLLVMLTHILTYGRRGRQWGRLHDHRT